MSRSAGYSARPLRLGAAATLALGAWLIFTPGVGTAEQEEQGAAAVATTIFVVRHAEKAEESDNSPSAALSDAGRARSARLGAMLRDADLAGVYATATRRALDTARPSAEGHALPIAGYDAGASPRAVVDRVLAECAGRAALVVGHSNTVPALVAAFTGGEPGDGLSGYDSIFVVTILRCGESRVGSVTRLRFSE